jgi:hypothetical protein
MRYIGDHRRVRVRTGSAIGRLRRAARLVGGRARHRRVGWTSFLTDACLGSQFVAPRVATLGAREKSCATCDNARPGHTKHALATASEPRSSNVWMAKRLGAASNWFQAQTETRRGRRQLSTAAETLTRRRYRFRWLLHSLNKDQRHRRPVAWCCRRQLLQAPRRSRLREGLSWNIAHRARATGSSHSTSRSRHLPRGLARAVGAAVVGSSGQRCRG